MGFYYEQQSPPTDDDPRPGCLDALVIMRVVFGLLFWPMLGLFGVVFGIALAVYLFTIHPLLGLLPVLAGVGIVALIARWDQRRSTPAGLGDD
jgi:hypothetical protein